MASEQSPQPFDPLARPTEDLVQKQKQYLLRLWQPALSSMATAYQFYLRQYPIWDSKKPREANRPTFRLGSATAIVDHAVDATLAFFPKVHREPPGGKEDAASSRLEKGTSAVLADSFLQTQYYPPKANGKQLAVANYTQLYVGLDGLDPETLEKPVMKEGEEQADFDRREWEWESKRHSWNPVRIEVPAPGEVLMNPKEKAPSIAIRNRKMLAFDLADLTRRKAKRRGVEGSLYEMRDDPYEEVEVTEWWSAHWYALKRADGNVLFVEPNSWGFQPFIHTFGGAAVTPLLSGMSWGQGQEAFDPRWYVEQGLLWPVMDDIVMIDQMIVSQHQLLLAASWARRGTTLDAAEAARQFEHAILQGEANQFWVEQLPQLPGQTFTHEEILKQDLERSTYSLLEAGFSQSNTDTATHIIVLSEKVHRKFQAAVVQMNHLYTLAASNVLKLVHRMKEVYGIDVIDMGKESLRAADIGGRFHIAVDFGQVDTVTHLQQKQDARQELAANIIDLKTYYSIARYEDPSGIQQGAVMDRAMRRPEVEEALEAAALRQAGFGGVADRLEEEARLRRQGVTGPDGKTPLFTPQAAMASSPFAPRGNGAAPKGGA